MAQSPNLLFISKGVRDLSFTSDFFRKIFDFQKFNSSGLKNENFNFLNDYFQSQELLNPQGGAFLQLIEIENSKIKYEEPDLTRLGILGIKINTHNIEQNFYLKREENSRLQPNFTYNPINKKHFHMISENILFQLIKSKTNMFAYLDKYNCGVSGAIIGVSNIEKSFKFYKKVLGYDKIIAKDKKVFNDFEDLKGGNNTFKRIVLQQSDIQNIRHKNFLGKTEIELIELIGKKQKLSKDYQISSLNFISDNNNEVVGNYRNLGKEYENYDNNEDVISLFDPDNLKITVQKQNENKKNNFFSDLKILSKILKK